LITKGILNQGPFSRIRRNHGLEHATLNLLARKQLGRAFAGHSDDKGFWIVGTISTEELLETVQAALQRMKTGERQLSLHANCGTNYLTAGIIAGTAAWLATLGKANRLVKKLERWPMMVMIITASLIAAQPLGPLVQARLTTSGEPGSLTVKEIVRYERQEPILHRVVTADAE
jgi:hypothetical protein